MAFDSIVRPFQCAGTALGSGSMLRSPAVARYSLFCAKPVASGVAMKSSRGPILAANSLAIWLLDRFNDKPPSRELEPLTSKAFAFDDPSAVRSRVSRPRHPLAEQRSNRYSTRRPEGGRLPRSIGRGLIEATSHTVEPDRDIRSSTIDWSWPH